MSVEARPVDSDDYSEKVVPLVPKLVLELDGDRGEFLGYAEPNAWALMQNAEAAKQARKGDRTANMAAMYRLAVTSVLPEDVAAFEEYMTAHGRNDDLADALGTALNDLWSGATMLPLVPTSSDLSGSTGTNGSTSTGDSLPADTAPLRLVDPPPTPEEEEQYGEWSPGNSSPDSL